VFLPQKGRNTICISSQIGCPVGCAFCASGTVKFVRNLTRGEIIEQILQISNDNNVVMESILFMGMGEPLLNYDNLVAAIAMLEDENGFGFGRRRIVVSTAGIVGNIEKLANEGLGVGLALSLHAPDDETRRKIIPDFKFKLENIVKAGVEYSTITKSRLTIEYMLISGINDDLGAAKKLAALIEKYTKFKDHLQINIIPYNPTDNCGWKTPNNDTVHRFKETLIKMGFITNVREPRGLDIGAACGQLLV